MPSKQQDARMEGEKKKSEAAALAKGDTVALRGTREKYMSTSNTKHNCGFLQIIANRREFDS